MMLKWNQAVLILWGLTFCTCSIVGSGEVMPQNFGHGLSPANLQSWDEWLTKRDLVRYPWSTLKLSGNQFQDWQDWMYKRGFLRPGGRDNLGLLDKSKFQEWKAWMSKRSPFSSAPLSKFSKFDNGQFQSWNDWISKRYFDMGTSDFGLGSRINFQNWQDIAKRQNFVFPSLDAGAPGNALFQNWQDWVSRMGPRKSLELSGYRVGGNKDHFIKRQLGFMPGRYDSFRRYFTDGLQDWRSTFKGVKRNQDDTDKKSDEQ